MHHTLTSLFAVMMTITAPVTQVGDIAICAVSEQVSGDQFMFTGHCPRFSGIGDAKAQKSLNAQMHEIVQGALFRTKAAAAVLPTDDRSEQQKAEGVFGYEVKRNGGGVVSLLFTDTLYAGRADTKQAKTGLSFYTGNGEVFDLIGLFMNSEEGMEQINKEVSRQLTERGLVTALQKQNPKIEAEQQFYLTNTDLVLIIPETTWFRREMGTVEFIIPFAKMNRCLKNQFAQ
ncbi:MAG TPA: hypothetical protein DEB10_01960 [Ruminococcaceae bacterium]|nr:hypothetical protein [Oscillospiraceae bacterium]HCA30863.1 hypothetical protein [Oscillospiraceae bacterium]